MWLQMTRQCMGIFQIALSRIPRNTAQTFRALLFVFSALWPLRSLLSLDSYYLNTFPRITTMMHCVRIGTLWLLINVSMRRMRSSNDRVCIPGRRVGERLGEKLITGRLASTGLLRPGMFMRFYPWSIWTKTIVYFGSVPFGAHKAYERHLSSFKIW